MGGFFAHKFQYRRINDGRHAQYALSHRFRRISSSGHSLNQQHQIHSESDLSDLIQM